LSLHHTGKQNALAEPELLNHRAWHEGVGSLACEVSPRIAKEAVTVRVHLKHARAGNQRQGIAIVAAFIFLAVIAIVGRTVSATSSAASTPASASSATTAASSATTTASAVVSVLAVISVPSAATSTASAPATPTLFLGHVTQNPYLNPVQKR
jgi:hypothetical protein